MDPSQLPCPSWVWATGSNVHAAKDRSWFDDDYISFPSFLEGFGVAENPKVLGIGTVRLPTKISPSETGPSSHSTLVLKNVLHVPSIFCNIIGMPLDCDYGVNMSRTPGTKGTISSASDGTPVAYFKPNAMLLQVQLSNPLVGPAVGPDPFDPETNYWINATWPERERQRFAALSASNGPLTPAEKEWLKKNYKNEFDFLRTHGLSIYKDEDRADGRTLLRGFMRDGEDPSGDGDDGWEDDLSDDDPIANMVSCEFSSEEVEWINSNYGNAHNFLVCFGLKFYNSEDVEEGQAIVRAMMMDSEDED